ncbi:hypothetical protein WN943_029118 [Citrus x changshan-huyou]
MDLLVFLTRPGHAVSVFLSELKRVMTNFTQRGSRVSTVQVCSPIRIAGKSSLLGESVPLDSSGTSSLGCGTGFKVHPTIRALPRIPHGQVWVVVRALRCIPQLGPSPGYLVVKSGLWYGLKGASHSWAPPQDTSWSSLGCGMSLKVPPTVGTLPRIPRGQVWVVLALGSSSCMELRVTTIAPDPLAAGFGCPREVRQKLLQQRTREMISTTHGHGASHTDRNSDGCEEKDQKKKKITRFSNGGNKNLTYNRAVHFWKWNVKKKISYIRNGRRFECSANRMRGLLALGGFIGWQH